MRALRHEAPKQGVNVALVAPGGTGKQTHYHGKESLLTRMGIERGMLDEKMLGILSGP
jgi:short-subunit dehydrogenase